MSASNAFETALLTLLMNNTNIAGIGDATGLRGSSAAGSFYLGLHTGDPGEAGNQTTNEATYTGYARVAVARSGAGWTISGNAVVNAATITFPLCSGGSNTIGYWSIGTDATGAGTLVLSGPLSSSLAVSTGITPAFAAGTLSNTVD